MRERRHQHRRHQCFLRQPVVEERNPHRQPPVAGQHAHRRAKPVDNGERQEPQCTEWRYRHHRQPAESGQRPVARCGADITLQSAQNSESTVGKNSSKGGNVGVGIGAGSGGYGISVSAGVNAGKGHENGNGLTHTETRLDAGSNLSLTSGRDTTLTGAQASGEKVTVDVGRNRRWKASGTATAMTPQTQMSGGISVPIGAGSGSANFSASSDKLHSNFDSVKEQTGLFAGKGGYDVKVKEHTQLDGAVIASTADKDKNRLDTGTLGWTDIHNRGLQRDAQRRLTQHRRAGGQRSADQHGRRLVVGRQQQRACRGHDKGRCQ